MSTSPPPTLRPALPSDLPAISTLIPTAMSLDPLYNYLYPHRHVHPTDHSTHISSQYGTYIASPDYTVMLATLPETSSSLDNANTTVVGVALWYHPTSSPTISTGSDKSSSSDRQDIDVINDEHFTTAMATAKTTFFDDVYGKTGHLHLQLLCTHPAFGRRGVGKAMVGWGISVARGDGTGVGMVEGRSMGVGEEEGKGKGVGVVSLMASQVGVGLYEGLGFKRLGWVRIGEGEEGEEMGEGLGLGLEAMVLDLREGGGGGAGEAGGGG